MERRLLDIWGIVANSREISLIRESSLRPMSILTKSVKSSAVTGALSRFGADSNDGQ